ncbi:MAG: hypothetical protein IJT23_11600 [Clostridia bacterium]|nr:hypothetical protein [Clostridia bacterium]
MCELNKNYQMLADAIIMQAVKDYRNSDCTQVQNSIENFFRSEYFAAICELDGERLIKRLRQERMIKNV